MNGKTLKAFLVG